MRFRKRTVASFNLAVMPGSLQQIDLVESLTHFDFFSGWRQLDVFGRSAGTNKKSQSFADWLLELDN